MNYSFIRLLCLFGVLFAHSGCSKKFVNKKSIIGSASKSLKLNGFNAKTDALFRNSCYCINCTLDEIPALKSARCKYIRWGLFPWEQQIELSSNPNAFSSMFTKQNEFVSQMKLELGNDSIFEFGIPEAVYSGISRISVSPEMIQKINSLISRFSPLSPRLNLSATPFTVADVAGEGGHADGFKVPKLDSQSGFAWHLYLGLSAIDSGAESISLTQMNLRFVAGYNEQLIQNLISALRVYGEETKGVELIFGAEANFSKDSPLANEISWKKSVLDLDIGQWDENNSDAYAIGKDGSKLACEFPEFMSKIENRVLATGQRTGPLCLLKAEDDKLRSFLFDDSYQHPHFVADNPNKLPVFLEMDGALVCRLKSDLYGPYQAYADNDAESDSTCRSTVRNGLTQNMQFLSQPKLVREEFLKYMDLLTIYMSNQLGFPVYFPKPIKVDQNFIFTFYRGELLARKSTQWLETQRQLIRHCPEGDIDAGLGDIDDSNYNMYLAERCDDLSYYANSTELTYREVVELGARNLYLRLVQREPDASGFDFWLTEILAGRKSLEDLRWGLINSDEYKELHSGTLPPYGDETEPPSSEASSIENLVETFYTGYLNRNSDPGGLAHHVESIQVNGCQEAATSFVAGLNFNGEGGEVFSNREFIRRVYEGFFGRSPDAGGHDHWEGRLNAGESRAAVFQILISPGIEYDVRCKAAMSL